MNVFATLKTGLLRSKFLSAPVPPTERRAVTSYPPSTDDAALSDHRCASGSGYPRRP